MSGWRGDVDQLLYAGEELRERVGGGPDEIVVTSHRLLAVTPEAAGPNLHAVDRPNVEGVDVETTGRRRYLTAGGKVLIAGLVSVLVGVVVDFEGIASAMPSPGADAPAAGGILAILDTVRTGLGLVDTVLFTVGGVLAVAGVVAVGAYWLTRERNVLVSVAGDDDVRLSEDGFTEADLARIETALEAE